MESEYNLERYIISQNKPGFGGYENAKKEMLQGQKLSHWLWYVFPYLQALDPGSINGSKYGVKSVGEAKAFLKNPTLRERYDESCEILLSHKHLTAVDIFGVKDSNRVRSSITLFYLASHNQLYRDVIDKLFGGVPCQKTLYALNMEMPKEESVKKIAKPLTHKKILNTSQYRETRHAQIDNNARKTRKVKKIIIFATACCLILSAVSGGTYYLYKMFVDDSGQSPYPTNNENFAVNVRVITDDKDDLDAEALKRNAINLEATLGEETVFVDSADCSYAFNYNAGNKNDKISIRARVESCDIGDFNWSCEDEPSAVKDVDEYMTLNVRTVDLRIYEELAWYESAHKEVAEAKYQQYISRINDVHNKAFADFLLHKLKRLSALPPTSKSEVKNKQADAEAKKKAEKAKKEGGHGAEKETSTAASVRARIQYLQHQGKVSPRDRYELKRIAVLLDEGVISEQEAMVRIKKIENRR